MSHSPDPTPALHLLVLRVDDLEASRQFYDRLGLTFQDERHGSGPAHLSARLGRTVLELYPVATGPTTRSVRLGLAVSDLAIVAAHLPVVSDIDRDGQRVLLVEDPDGHRIELTQTGLSSQAARTAHRGLAAPVSAVAHGDILGAYRQTWNQVLREFLGGGPSVPGEFRQWFGACHGAGRGAIDVDALPEPWIGDLDVATCRGVTLGLNPGPSDLAFQGRGGIFAEEIRRHSFSEWAATWPYLRDPWQAKKGKNRYHRSRLRFLRQWTDIPHLPAAAMVAFEMYPWHSDALTATLSPDPGLVREWVLQPVRALGAPVFAFGAPWLQLLPRLGLVEVDRLGAGGRPFGGQIASRTVVVYDLDGVPLVAEKHTGSAGPPSPAETALVRAAVGYPA